MRGTCKRVRVLLQCLAAGSQARRLIMSEGRKAVQEVLGFKLPKAVTWDSLAFYEPDNSPAARWLLPPVHAPSAFQISQATGGKCFPPTISLQFRRGSAHLRRFDVYFLSPDMPSDTCGGGLQQPPHNEKLAIAFRAGVRATAGTTEADRSNQLMLWTCSHFEGESLCRDP